MFKLNKGHNQILAQLEEPVDAAKIKFYNIDPRILAALWKAVRQLERVGVPSVQVESGEVPYREDHRLRAQLHQVSLSMGDGPQS